MYSNTYKQLLKKIQSISRANFFVGEIVEMRIWEKLVFLFFQFLGQGGFGAGVEARLCFSKREENL
jgi:hypothetical protein